MTYTLLSLDDVLELHRDALERWGDGRDPDGIRDPAVLERALEGPLSVVQRRERADAVIEWLPFDIYDCAGALVVSIARGQPFIQGNKRTAFAAARCFLGKNGVTLPEEACLRLREAMLDVYSGVLTRADVADMLRSGCGASLHPELVAVK